MERLYFDYNATTPLAPQVLRLMAEMGSVCGNASSVHKEGRESLNALEKARSHMAQMLGAKATELLILSGATEANNTVLASAGQARKPHQNILVLSRVEHQAMIAPAEELKGVEIRWIEVDREGRIDLAQVFSLLDDRVFLVSLMLANNETGMIFPVKKVAALARDKGILCHTDAACAVGKTAISFSDLGVDFMTVSAHKCYGPVGVGGLFIKTGTPFSPLLRGGSHEVGRRAGTPNVVGALAMQQALAYALSDLDFEEERLQSLREELKEGIKKLSATAVFHESQHQLSGTLNVAFPGLSGQVLLANLDLEGVAASFGSACQSGTLEVSRVIQAMGVPDDEAYGTIRLSFGKMTSKKDVEGLLLVLEKVLKRMS